MRAWMLRRSGSPDVLRLEDVAVPDPGPGRVRVRVERIGINYAEILSRKGLYSWAPKRPYVPGMEASGTIDAVGPGVERSVGERVLCGMQTGAYAEYVVVPQARALPALPHLTDAENAAFAVNFMTAWVALVEMARLRAPDRVAVSAAAGGVGTAAVQIAAAHGCFVTGLAGSDEKLERVRALGAAAGVNYRRDGWADAWEPEGGGLDVVLELVGADVFTACRQRLAPFGRLVVAGYAALDYSLWNPVSWWRAWRGAPRMDIVKASQDSIGIMATHIGYLLPDEERLLRVWRALTAFAGEHRLRPVVGATYPFERLPEAHAFMESRKSVGKILVEL
ncbi:MAG: zinc-binding dehydrogenase [Longimicrobiales bacterium]